MTVKELIEILNQSDPDAKVFIAKGDNNGCDTCGYGETFTEWNLKVTDLDTKVIFEVD